MSRIQERKKVPPFLDVQPPHWAARGLSYLLILLFLMALIGGLTIRVPQSVSSPFTLVPVRGTDPMRALYNGTILEVRAAEGQFVQKGAPIFMMRADDAVDRASEYQTLETKLKGASESLSNVTKKHQSQRLADLEEIRGLEAKKKNLERTLELKKAQLALLEDKAESYRKMYETGILSKAEYTNQKLLSGSAAVESQELDTELGETSSQLEKLRYDSHLRDVEFQEEEHTWNDELEKTQLRMNMLHTGGTQVPGEDLALRASCNGTILKMRVNSAGAVVQDGDVLCELACSGRMLQAELTVPQQGIGLIKAGQGVKLLYDSFPYQRYGVQYGIVRWISPAGLTFNDSQVFHVLVDLKTDSIRVHGQNQALLGGMGGRAEVVVERRRLVSYAFEPIRQLRENLRQPSETK